jgi:hypothetical protein
MKQIDYFKFLRLFPEIVDIEDSVEVKKVLIEEVKKISKVQKEKTKLLPVNIHSKIKVEDIRRVGIEDYWIKVMFKKNRIFDVIIIKYKSPTTGQIVKPTLAMIRKMKLINEDRVFLSKEDITNLKRTILIDNILK